jgi:hypothetical protein
MKKKKKKKKVRVRRRSRKTSIITQLENKKK